MGSSRILTELEMFELCRRLHEHQVDIGAALVHLTRTYVAVVERDAGLVEPFRERLAILLQVPDPDVWFQTKLAGYDNFELKYALANNLAAACILARDYTNALTYFSLALVAHRAEPTAADTIALERASEYNDEPVHIDLAQRLCMMASPILARTAMRGRPAKVIDLCCGTGLNSDYFAAVCDTVTGIDLETAGLLASPRRQRYEKILQGDAREVLTRLEGAYDLILSTAGVYFFRELDWLFASAKRLLNPGGILLFNGWPCPDTRDYLVTMSGNFRYCHSAAYLRRMAAEHALEMDEPSWHVVYGAMPNWFIVVRQLDA